VGNISPPPPRLHNAPKDLSIRTMDFCCRQTACLLLRSKSYSSLPRYLGTAGNNVSNSGDLFLFVYYLENRKTYEKCFLLITCFILPHNACTHKTFIIRDSSVGIATGYGLDDQGSGSSSPVNVKIFTSPYRPYRL
jgi:hypothetical protein